MSEIRRKIRAIKTLRDMRKALSWIGSGSRNERTARQFELMSDTIMIYRESLKQMKDASA